MGSLEGHDEEATRTATPGGGTPVLPVAAASIGRFAVLGHIGAGGMGQVFAAYDARLDRRVALKLLRGRGDPTERARLVREAQALARLSHPNVVAVHEVGEHEGHVYVAMEFVEGVTLREWMDANPAVDAPVERRSRGLQLLLDAGRGIQAAHAAGLVHRDIKPRNILVGNDGRVRVVDFGLARSGAAEELAATVRTAPEDDDTPDDEPSASGPLLGTALTQTGKVVGTPAYMAPEQFHGEFVDPAADQFAFCVTAWELLFGVRPFGGTTMAMLMAMRDGELERPAEIDVPQALEAALRRGLSFKPSRRHDDMAALLQVLETELRAVNGDAQPQRARGRWVLAASIAATVTAGAFWLGGRETARCDGAAEHFVGLWDVARKAELREAILATDAAFAEGTWSRLEANVDGWRDGWESAYRDACVATHERGEQSERLLDLRMACLDARRQELSAYLGLLATPNIGVLATAEQGFLALPKLEPCADLEYVQTRGTRSEDPKIAAIEDEVLEAVARATSMQEAGDDEGALAIAETALARAEGSELARAHALLAKGRALRRTQPLEASQVLQAAYESARASDAGEVAAMASIALADSLQGDGLGGAETWLTVARAEATRLASPEQMVVVETVDGAMLAGRGELDAAERAFDRAFAILESAGLIGTLEHARALRARSWVPASKDRVANASAALELAVGILGENHPAVADYHRALAYAYDNDGDEETALEQARRGLEISELAFGADDARLALHLIAVAQFGNRRPESLATLQRAAALLDGVRPHSHLLARIREIEGRQLMEVADYGGAAVALREAYDLYHNTLGTRHAATADVMIMLGTAEHHVGIAGGSARIELGLALLDVILARDLPFSAKAFNWLAGEARMAGRYQEAYDWQLRARDLQARLSSSDKRPLSVFELNLCGIASELERHDLALAHCAAAIKLVNLTSPVWLGHVENNFGVALFNSHRLEEALPHYERAEALWTKEPGPESYLVSAALANQAEIHLAQGDATSARRLYLRALSLRERQTATNPVTFITPLVGISSAALALGDRTEAIATAERALTIATDADRDLGDTRLLARSSEALALALRHAPSNRRDRTRALALMQQALATFEAHEPTPETDVTRVRAWLDAHGAAAGASAAPPATR